MCKAVELRMQRIEKQGIAKGIAKGKAQEVYESVAEGDYSIKRGMQKLGIDTEEEFRKRAAVLGYKIP